MKNRAEKERFGTEKVLKVPRYPETMTPVRKVSFTKDACSCVVFYDVIYSYFMNLYTVFCQTITKFIIYLAILE
jgi:hypothetical protein